MLNIKGDIAAIPLFEKGKRKSQRAEGKWIQAHDKWEKIKLN